MSTELGNEERRWLEALRSADEPTAADQTRVRALVLAGVASTGVGAAATATATASKLGGFGAAWKIGLTALSLGALAAGGAWIAPRSSPATRVEAPAHTKIVAPAKPAERAAAADGATQDLLPAPEVAAPRSAPQLAKPSAKDESADDIEAELALLSKAQRALAAHDANGALAALAEHRSRFPHGSLQAERSGLGAVAACDAGHADGAQLAQRFLRAYPRSPLAARVRAACLSR